MDGNTNVANGDDVGDVGDVGIRVGDWIVGDPRR